MLAGLLELAKVAEDNPALKDVNRHMLMVMGALCCYVASLRLHGTHFIAPGLLAIALSVSGFLCLVVAGWLGGKLVYGHRLGVSPPDET